jgi:hypothetical protein
MVGAQIQGSSYQPLVSGKDDSCQHRFIDETVSHPFADDDIDFLDWQSDLLHFALNQSDNCWMRREKKKKKRRGKEKSR